MKFIDYVKSLKKFNIIIIPDTDNPSPVEDLKDIIVNEAAAFDFDKRLAVYEYANLNFFVNNGPCVASELNTNINSIMMKLVVPSVPHCTEEFIKWQGYEVGKSPKYNDKANWTWEDDSFKVMKDNFDEFLKFDLWNLFALKQYNLWHLLAITEIKQRFRRSILGTLWFSLGTGIAIAGLGPLYSVIFGIELGEYFVYISISLITWNYINGTVQEATGVFIGHESFIKDLNISYPIFIYKLVWKNTLIFLQNLIMVAIIFLIFGQIERYNPHYLLLMIPILFLLLCNVSLLIALLSTRFRDVAEMIKSGMMVLFFLTPILWKPGRNMDAEAFILKYNPLYYIINVPRDLCLYKSTNFSDIIIILLLCIISFIIAELMFKKFKKQIIFWI